MAAFGSLILGGLGTLTILVGLVIALGLLRHRYRSQSVQIEVISNRKTRDSDGHAGLAPVFRIRSGPHEGKQWPSRLTEGSAAHKVGERMTGSYDPKTGVIHSPRTQATARFIAISFLVIGSVLVAFGLAR